MRPLNLLEPLSAARRRPTRKPLRTSSELAGELGVEAIAFRRHLSAADAPKPKVGPDKLRDYAPRNYYDRDEVLSWWKGKTK